MEPPSEGETIEILLGIKDRYESVHHVGIHSEPWTPQLPRAATSRTASCPTRRSDLVDEAGARAKLREAGYSEEFGEINKSIRVAVEQMESAVSAKDFDKAQFYREQEAVARETLKTVREKFDVARGAQKGRRLEGEIDEVVSKGPGSAVVDQSGRGRQAAAHGAGAAPPRDQPGEGDSRGVARHPAIARRLKTRTARRQLHVPRPDRRGKGRDGAGAGAVPVRQRDRAHSLRMSEYMRSIGVEADWLAAGIRGHEEGGQLRKR